MALSYADIEGIWIQAGGSAATAPLAAAIAMAESGGNPNSLNNNARTGDLSYGLWQINMIGSMGPSREKEFGISNYNQLLDPVTNAKAAVKVSNGGTNFSPWTTFTSGAYQRFLNGNVPPNMTAGGASGGSGSTAPGATLASDPITGAVDGVEQWVEGIFNYLFFALLVASGLTLILAGTLGLTVGGDPLTKGSPLRAGKEVVLFKKTGKVNVAAPKSVSTRESRTYRIKNAAPRAAKAPTQRTQPIASRQSPKRVASERTDRREIEA